MHSVPRSPPVEVLPVAALERPGGAVAARESGEVGGAEQEGGVWAQAGRRGVPKARKGATSFRGQQRMGGAGKRIDRSATVQRGGAAWRAKPAQRPPTADTDAAPHGRH